MRADVARRATTRNRGACSALHLIRATRAPCPPPRYAGENEAIAFSRRPSRPSFAARTKATDVSPPNKIKGGGAPEGANRIGRTARTDVATCPRYGRGARHGRSACTNRPLRARSPFGAPPRLWPRFLGLGFSTSGQVSWDAAVCGSTLASCPSAAGTPRTGRNTGGRCPKPPGSGLRDRPREPHSLHFQDRI